MAEIILKALVTIRADFSYLTAINWYPRWDSNPQNPDFKSGMLFLLHRAGKYHVLW